MKKEDLLNVYDSTYANDYNERFLLSPFTKPWAEFEQATIEKQIDKEDSRWVDIGCGTGYFLSKFPGKQRAGLDINPEMLKKAKEANPDALFFKEGDFRINIPEWKDSWSLVSCMWTPYNYVDSLKEVEILVSNMIEWTKVGGAIFLPVIDFEELRPRTPVTYDEYAFEFGGNILIDSVTWTWIEENGKVHEHLISPHIGHFIKLMEAYFDKIEVLRYPYHPAASRKALLATGRRKQVDFEKLADVIWHEKHVPEIEDEEETELTNPIESSLSHKQLILELGRRVTSGKIFKAMIRRILS
jgi:SAM-dependent methyltransferase